MDAFITVSSANIYRNPTFHSELDTQAVLGEHVQIIKQDNEFFRVICEDGYEGWVHNKQVTESKDLSSLSPRMITANQVLLYAEPDAQAKVIRDAVAGSYVHVVSQTENWVRVLLPDGVDAWLEQSNFSQLPDFSRNNLISYAHRFMGVPYYWAGKTVKGFDCSGYVQFVHKMFGMLIRRDAWIQFNDAKPLSDDPLFGEAGDLMFFAESGDKITHVGFCLGEGKILHAQGMVGINSLVKTDPLFSENLLKTFSGIRTYLKKYVSE